MVFLIRHRWCLAMVGYINTQSKTKEKKINSIKQKRSGNKKNIKKNLLVYHKLKIFLEHATNCNLR